MKASATERPPLHPVAMIGRFFAGLVVVALGAANGFFWWFVSAWRCDESCDDRSTAWRDNPDAWQWSALGLLGGACFVCCAAFAASLATRHPRLSAALLIAGVTTGVAPWILS